MTGQGPGISISRVRLIFMAVVAAVLCRGVAQATVTVLVGEPYGAFGTMMPVGHAAIYLDHVCADGPLKLRRCRLGEQEGVVIARYYRLGEVDWVATPVMQFLYATDRVERIPEFASAERVRELRQVYRQGYLAALVPDGMERAKATEEWVETVGVAYDRRLWGYRLDSSAAQDEDVIDWVNRDRNRHAYHLRRTNCADFVAQLLRVAYPDLVTRANRIADFGVMSPKQVARSVAAYSDAHEELHPQVVEIAQVPGSLRRSRPVRGGAESLLKTKRYLATLLVILPEIPAGLGVMYLARGRWELGRGAEVIGPEAFDGARQSVVATR